MEPVQEEEEEESGQQWSTLNFTTDFRLTATSRERESKSLQRVQVKVGEPAEIGVTTVYLSRYRIYSSIPINSKSTGRNKSI